MRLFQRRDRDSNPGTSKLVNGFRDRPVRPLRHLSMILKNLEAIFTITPPRFRFAKIQTFFILKRFFVLETPQRFPNDK